MATRGEVSYKVKRAALILRQFTIGQMADVTGLDHSSVETAVHRLVRAETLVRAEVERKPSRGRPRQRYALAKDPAQIQKLRMSVEAFQMQEPPSHAAQYKPESPHYLQALSQLDTIEQENLDPSSELLDEIEQQLAFARRYEDMLEDGVEVSTAHLDFAQARLEFIQENTSRGEQLLARARAVFQGFDLDAQVRLLDEYTVTLALRRQLATIAPAALRAPGAPSEQLKEAIEPLSRLTVSPALSHVILQLAETADAAVRENARLARENEQLQSQVSLLVESNWRLRLEHQSSLALGQMLLAMPRQPIPSYPSQGFSVPVHEEDPDEFIPKDLVRKALVEEFWPEADAQPSRRRRGKGSRFSH